MNRAEQMICVDGIKYLLLEKHPIKSVNSKYGFFLEIYDAVELHNIESDASTDTNESDSYKAVVRTKNKAKRHVELKENRTQRNQEKIEKTEASKETKNLIRELKKHIQLERGKENIARHKHKLKEHLDRKLLTNQERKKAKDLERELKNQEQLRKKKTGKSQSKNKEGKFYKLKVKEICLP